MYHAIVAARVRELFQKLGQVDYTLVLDSLAPGCEHSFFGSHALGGTRRTRAAIKCWYERLPRVLPGLSFKIERIFVTGWPWATAVAVEWRDFGRAGDGTAFTKRAFHQPALRQDHGNPYLLRHCASEGGAGTQRRLRHCRGGCGGNTRLTENNKERSYERSGK